MSDAMGAASLDAGFARPYLTVFCRLDELGLEATGLRLVSGSAFHARSLVPPHPYPSAQAASGAFADPRHSAACGRVGGECVL